MCSLCLCSSEKSLVYSFTYEWDEMGVMNYSIHWDNIFLSVYTEVIGFDLINGFDMKWNWSIGKLSSTEIFVHAFHYFLFGWTPAAAVIFWRTDQSRKILRWLQCNVHHIGKYKKSISSIPRQYPDNKVHGANMWPTWVLWAPDGPHIGPMNLAISS